VATAIEPDSASVRDIVRALAPGADVAAAPLLPPGLVRRRRVLERVEAGRGAPCVLVVAPAGYGKTTLLATATVADDRPSVWLSLTRADDDPTAILARVLLALDALEPLREGAFTDVLGSEAGMVDVRLARLADVVSRRMQPFVLVLDDAHTLRNPDAIDIVRTMVEAVPRGSTIAIATRSASALGLARERANGRILDVRADDLEMSESEGMALLANAGIDVSESVARSLVERCEGWPAGLYLCALALRSAPARAQAAFGGTEPIVAAYLRDEILSTTPPKLRDFMLRTSVLDRLNGSLCDAVLDRQASATVLDALADANRFVTRLDSGGAWYRYHHLFQDLLRADLERREPELIPELHRRASEWFEGVGDIDEAIRHAQAAGERARVIGLMWAVSYAYLGAGRDATVARWLEPFSPEQIASHPALALIAAWRCWTSGDTSEVETWVDVAASSELEELPDGKSLRAAVAVLRANIGGRGLSDVRANAALAATIDRPDSHDRLVALVLEGAASWLLGDTERGRERLEQAAAGGAIFMPSALAQALGFLALLAADDDRWEEADARYGQGLRVIAEFGLQDRPAFCVFYAGAALAAARVGDAGDARARAKHAAALLALLRNVARWAAIETCILLCRTSVLLGELDDAQHLVGQATQLLADYHDAGSLPARLRDVVLQLEQAALPLGLRATPLTTAELRVLRYLPTHLSFAQIADELFVSRNTVKTQAVAVYRKLEVTSRAEAVERARALGLVDA
jgi:LuxR family transcriptional regulator, maltose regulon positive regulatory protein